MSEYQDPEVLKKKQQAERETKFSKQNKENVDTNQNQADISIRKRLAAVPNLYGESELEKRNKSEWMSSDQITLLNQMIEMVSNVDPTKELSNIIDKRIPTFDMDSFPAECDITMCKQRLQEHYENTRSCKFGFFSYKQSGKTKHEDLLKRLGNNLKETLAWYTSSKPGDVNKNAFAIPYDPRVLHSFSNQANRSEILTPGTCHVAVGFTDLSIFNRAKYNKKLSKNKPLRWIGYEASAFCVAKTAIIATMMSMNAPTDDILQVWYSATWKKDTLTSFRAAIQYLLNSNTFFSLFILIIYSI